MIFKRKLSNLELPHDKATTNVASVPIAPPSEVLLPMTMHSGSPAEPVVNVGDHVCIGQLIAREEGRNSSPVHATISGTVTAIEPYGNAKAIRIQSDEKMEVSPDVRPPEVHDLDSFLASVRESGIVGLGGAAFPVWAKLDAVRRGPVKTVLINGAECEPYLTGDNRTMVEHSDLIVKGIDLLKTYLKSEKFIIGIEKNKPEAIAHLTEVFSKDPAVEVLPLDCTYPQGAKQMLLYNATGKVVEAGQRLASLEVIIINVTSLAKVAKFMETGMPLVDRCVTVDGSAVKEPKNLVVPVGTSVGYILEQAGGLKEAAGKIVMGGPMMGHTVTDLKEPIVKATGGILAFNEKDAKVLEPTACIHCGRCVNACPMGLNPVAFSKAMEMEDDEARYELLTREQVKVCIECGACSYVCPAHRQLVKHNIDGKGFLRKYQAAK